MPDMLASRLKRFSRRAFEREYFMRSINTFVRSASSTVYNSNITIMQRGRKSLSKSTKLLKIPLDYYHDVCLKRTKRMREKRKERK